ncbi:MAG: tRNA 5-methylaminomethyl-2-thiouridine synthase [Bradyrhizobium sp.]|nr:tRNA 5-methylaminomethyl-2-thiouridine synthase [Bradyrhizobium sp.]
MSRYFFRITNGKPHDDEVGEELRDERAAWLAAKRLTRDIEDTLEPNAHWKVEVRDADGPIYSISIAGRKLR